MRVAWRDVGRGLRPAALYHPLVCSAAFDQRAIRAVDRLRARTRVVDCRRCGRVLAVWPLTPERPT